MGGEFFVFYHKLKNRAIPLSRIRELSTCCRQVLNFSRPSPLTPSPAGAFVATVDLRYSNAGELHTKGRLLAVTETGGVFRGFLTDDISTLWTHGSAEGVDVGSKRSRPAECD